MTVQAVQSPSKTGATPTYGAVAASDTFTDDGAERTMLHVKNGGGSSDTVTIPAQQTTANIPGVGPVTVPDIVVAVPNGGERYIGPFPAAYINSSGLVTANHSFITSVTCAVVKIPKVS